MSTKLRNRITRGLELERARFGAAAAGSTRAAAPVESFLLAAANMFAAAIDVRDGSIATEESMASVFKQRSRCYGVELESPHHCVTLGARAEVSRVAGAATMHPAPLPQAHSCRLPAKS